MDSFQLPLGHVALVTGAGRGFGAGIALAFARAGAKVCVTDVNEGELHQTIREIELEGGTALPVVADVSKFADMQNAVQQTVERWGRLDTLVNNAAIMPLIPFAKTTPDLWRKMIDVDLTGVYNSVKAAWNQMVQQGGGHCISIASGSSVRGFVNEVAYCAAKHGIEGFTKALAMEAEPLNIAINTMGPGKPIKPTSITRVEWDAMPAEEQKQWADPAYLGNAFVWLAAQPPQRFTGLRFDAGPIADAIAAEGWEFDFDVEKVTLYADDLRERIERRKEWTGLHIA